MSWCERVTLKCSFFHFPKLLRLKTQTHNDTSGQICEEKKKRQERGEAGVREKSIFETATATATQRRHTWPYTHARTILRQARCQAKLMARCAYARLATRAADSKKKKKASKKKKRRKSRSASQLSSNRTAYFFLIIILACSSAHCHCFSSSLKDVKRKDKKKKEDSVSEACVLGLRIFATSFV